MVRILFEDKDIVVAVKPAGVMSEGAMPALLLEQTGSECLVVHRLDRETAGIMVFAKTKNAAAGLSKQIQEGRMKKIYLARVTKAPEPKSGEMKDLLFHDRQKNKTYVVKRERKGVKDAALLYKTLSEDENGADVEIELLTGRTHQIRVQFASRGCPLSGDGKYGGRAACAGGENTKMSLTAKHLEFYHPVTNEKLFFDI